MFRRPFVSLNATNNTFSFLPSFLLPIPQPPFPLPLFPLPPPSLDFEDGANCWTRTRNGSLVQRPWRAGRHVSSVLWKFGAQGGYRRLHTVRAMTPRHQKRAHVSRRRERETAPRGRCWVAPSFLDRGGLGSGTPQPISVLEQILGGIEHRDFAATPTHICVSLQRGGAPAILTCCTLDCCT